MSSYRDVSGVSDRFRPGEQEALELPSAEVKCAAGARFESLPCDLAGCRGGAGSRFDVGRLAPEAACDGRCRSSIQLHC
jgi:hypothetical protein